MFLVLKATAPEVGKFTFLLFNINRITIYINTAAFSFYFGAITYSRLGVHKRPATIAR